MAVSKSEYVWVDPTGYKRTYTVMGDYAILVIVTVVPAKKLVLPTADVASMVMSQELLIKPTHSKEAGLD